MMLHREIPCSFPDPFSSDFILLQPGLRSDARKSTSAELYFMWVCWFIKFISRLDKTFLATFGKPAASVSH